MGSLRAWLRASALILWTAGIFLAWALALPSAWVSPGWVVRWRAGLLHRWSRGARRILGIELAASGPLPKGAFLLVANHLSYVDVVAFAGLLRCAFVAKAEVRDWPVIGWMVAAMNTVFVDRDNPRSIPAALDRIDQLTAAGCGVVIFPEGTSSCGAGVQRFHPSLLAHAAAARSPVHAAALGYSTPPQEPPAHLGVCWWGDMTFPDHFWRLLSMRGFRATVSFGDAPIRDSDRKRLADSLEAAVVAQFTPVVDMEEACA